MKQTAYTLIFMGGLFFSSQLAFAETNLEEKLVKEEVVKELRVEDSATRIGEEVIKTRALIMNVGQANELANEANLNIGKLEFYVK
jgi:hypothetical protein